MHLEFFCTKMTVINFLLKVTDKKNVSICHELNFIFLNFDRKLLTCIVEIFSSKMNSIFLSNYKKFNFHYNFLINLIIRHNFKLQAASHVNPTPFSSNHHIFIPCKFSFMKNEMRKKLKGIKL